jgi:hypothetical protein
MSNTLAIAAVTAALQKLIETAIQLDDGSAKVTIRPPDKVTDALNQLNLFLYHAEVDAAYRNLAELPRQARPGESGRPALPLRLHYLLSAYGKDAALGDDASHRLLGRAASVLHDHALLGPDELKNALPGSDLHEQVERVRVTTQPLSLDEVSKLWSALQTPYRLSLTYQVSVVLLDSQQPARTPLPVLTIGPNDAGVIAQPSLVPPYPALDAIALPAHQSTAQLGDALTLTGHHLSGTAVEARLAHPRLDAPIVIPSSDFTAASAASISFVLPAAGNAPFTFPAGVYGVTVAVTDGGVTRVTNELALAVSPRILSLAPLNAAPGDFTLTAQCVPQVRPEQRLRLLFGDREIAPQDVALPAAQSDPSTLLFDVTDAAAGEHYARLRVDGVDSILVQWVGAPPAPQFDPALKVTLA